MTKRIRPNTNYRKIYEQHHGPIPKDEDGRSYEIHHIDSDHTNNDPSNLKAVTIQEHYDIHYAQGDYGACYFISIRMKMSPTEISSLASEIALRRVRDGTNPFLNPEIARQNNLKRLADGTHPFLDGEMSRRVQQKRIQDGTHNLLGGTLQRKLIAEGRHNLVGGALHRRLVAEGRHNMLGGQVQRDRVANKTHNFLGSDNNQKRLELGTHQTQIKITCPKCGKSGSVPPMKRWHFDNCKWEE